MTETTDVPRPSRVLTVLRRTPLTIAFVVVLLVIGIATDTLWSPASAQPWFERVATGLPAFADGRWWSVFTSPFFIDRPIVFLTLMPLVIGGIGWAEWKFGWLRTLGLFWAGHIVGVLGAAAVVALVSQTGWHWAVRLAGAYDVGPSCGAFTALVFAIATLPSPWRLRARIAVVVWVGVSVLYLGQLFDLEHAVAMVAALAVSGTLPAFRHPAGRPSEREWRLIALAGLVVVGAVQILDLVVPYDGPLGRNQPVASLIDVATDLIIILLVANGIRQGYRLAWIVTLVLGAYNLLTSVFAFLAVPLLVQVGLLDRPSDVIGLVVAPTVFWAALMLVLIIGRGAFRVPLRRSKRIPNAEQIDRDELIARLRRFGGGTISWMTTWEPNRRIAVGGRDTDGPGGGSGSAGLNGAAAYQAHAGVAIMLGDPITAAEDHAAALEQFTSATQRAGLIPCVFSASEAVAAARPEGWRAVVVAEDTIVDLQDLEFSGKRWAAARTAINRAEREGIEFRMVRLAEQPWNVLAQVRAISEQWAGDKGLPEMRFTLGTVEEALDPEAWVGLAVDAEGNLHGVTSWLPVYGAAVPQKGDGASGSGDPRIVGWTLDLMRRRDGGFGPVMEFLIASSAKHFSNEGYQFVSLSGAPLVRPADLEAGPVDQVLEQIGGLIEPLYGFKSLHRFKQKFNPRHESLYLLFRDEGDLPRIGIAITKAYLPDATLRDLVASAAATGRE